MKPPTEPTKDDCCNSGCNPCIFDVYDTHLKLYEKYLNQDCACDSYNVTDYGISQLEYRKFYLYHIIQISDQQKMLFFQKSKQYSQKVSWKPGDHFLIKHTSDNDISCTRAYTPIKLKINSDGPLDYDFLIVIKKYSNGLVSNYLFHLNIGQETAWRGPYGSYNVEPNKFSKIIMLAQGTGIAPFVSIIQNILNNDEDMTRIILYYCCQDLNEILFRDELYEFNSYWNFSYKIFLSNTSEESYMNKKYNEPLVNSKFNVLELDYLKSHSNNQYLLCGSVQFMKEYEVVLKNGSYSDHIILF
ncbi:NADH-cytochrome b5 reductase-like [Bicyclus anynana]|uniref:NADH-cytochrome b5 reductase n=1 Tax=Bicyclus anynana TaxID=110368 RepID=A0ABM3LHW1_BICAN|nr:NADH-cytochrome b5 reductase-like [Bicyclus anynana]